MLDPIRAAQLFVIVLLESLFFLCQKRRGKLCFLHLVQAAAAKERCPLVFATLYLGGTLCNWSVNWLLISQVAWWCKMVVRNPMNLFQLALICMVLASFVLKCDAAEFSGINLYQSVSLYPGNLSSAPLGLSLSPDGGEAIVIDESGAYVWTKGKGLEPVYEINNYSFLPNPLDLPPNHRLLLNYSPGVSPILSSEQGYLVRLEAPDGYVGPALVSSDEVMRIAEGIADSSRHFPLAISANGATVVGDRFTNNGASAFVWTMEDGFIDLGDKSSSAVDVSDDGTIVTGNMKPEESLTRGKSVGFLWTADSGFTPIATQMQDVVFNPTAISGDGTLVVGQDRSDNSLRYMLWDDNAGLRYVDSIEGEFRIKINDLNYDGSRMVGSSALGPSPDINDIISGAELPPTHAVIWDADETVPHDLRQWLIDNYQLADELAGWRLLQANSISMDGNVIAGVGIDPNGNTQGWVVRIPEPATSMLATLALGMVVLVRRRVTGNNPLAGLRNHVG